MMIKPGDLVYYAGDEMGGGPDHGDIGVVRGLASTDGLCVDWKRGNAGEKWLMGQTGKGTTRPGGLKFVVLHRRPRTK